jgi:hypothetical protein
MYVLDEYFVKRFCLKTRKARFDYTLKLDYVDSLFLKVEKATAALGVCCLCIFCVGIYYHPSQRRVD